MEQVSLPPSVRNKVQLLFEGIRYSVALGNAAEHAFPNFYPYRFEPGEHDPTGQGVATIPFLLTLEDGTLVRVRGEAASSWFVSGSAEAGYRLSRDGDAGRGFAIEFDPLPRWMAKQTSDGFPMAQAGIMLHADMAVVNVAPGCEYFQAGKGTGEGPLRCDFCAYGAPDARSSRLGQVMGQPGLPAVTYRRMQETLTAALSETTIRHIYLVGGCMVDWALEGERYLELARRVQEVVSHRVPVTCGSGALPDETQRRLHDEGLVDAVCYNLEVWSERLFVKVSPGKQRFVGYERWIKSLEAAVKLWGPGRVYSAMVAGIELKPEFGLTTARAAELALEGAEDLCSRGIIPVYSLYWPAGARSNPEYLTELRNYFEVVAAGYLGVRNRHQLKIWDGFMCHRCAYMQVECDMDRFS